MQRERCVHRMHNSDNNGNDSDNSGNDYDEEITLEINDGF